MECKKIKNLLIDFVDKKLDKEQTDLVKVHLKSCKPCANELEELLVLMTDLNNIKDEKPPAKLRTDFLQMVESEKLKQTTTKAPNVQKQYAASFRRINPFLQIAAGFTILISGVIIGLIAKNPGSSDQIANLQSEITGLKQMVILSKLDQQSPTTRIQAVSYMSEIQDVDPEITAALVRTMNTDDNINVRMAAITALSRYTDNDMVRNSLIESLAIQDDPFIQITLINMMIQLNEKRASNYLEQIIKSEHTNKTVKTMANKGLNILT